MLPALYKKHALLLRVASLVQVDDALLEERLEAVRLLLLNLTVSQIHDKRW
jgi:hypothetical protein